MAIWDKISLGNLYLGGPSANPTWNVPVALHSLYGEIEAADLLVRQWEVHLDLRLSGKPTSSQELGFATTCIVVTSLVTERALKTLIAQSKPDDDVPRSHNLSDLFHKSLRRTEQESVQRRLEALPRLWRDFTETSTAAHLLGMASNNFVDWRYAMEPGGATGGIPKPLLAVAISVTLVGIDLLSSWQNANGISSPQ